jgi:hypothetical protein
MEYFRNTDPLQYLFSADQTYSKTEMLVKAPIAVIITMARTDRT